MAIYRTLMIVLSQWKEAHNCKPLMRRGARQVGRRYILPTHTYSLAYRQNIFLKQ